MSETSALRPGQKVTLSGTVVDGPRANGGSGDAYAIELDGMSSSSTYYFPQVALTPVVEPEPQWQPGDVVRIDGVNHMLHEHPLCSGWVGPANERVSMSVFSQRWQEGRVVVVYRKEADK